MHRDKVLNIRVKEALISRITEATQDPFVLLKYGDQFERTDVKENTPTNPKWNQTFILKFKPKVKRIEIECYDFDSKSKSDLIGGGFIDVNDIKPFKKNEFAVEIFFKERSAGKVFIDIISEGDIVEPEVEGKRNSKIIVFK
jgi:Ca2+-dependent lipid-binding protein